MINKCFHYTKPKYFMEKRLFSMTFDDLILLANLFHNEFVVYKDKFTAYSSIFNDPFSANLKSLIEETSSLEQYNHFKNTSAVFKIELNQLLMASLNHYIQLVFFLKIAFSNSEAVLNAFGKNQYNFARRTPSRMISLLELAYNNANSDEYRQSLIDSGYSQLKIDGLLEISNSLKNKYLAHQQLQNDSSKKTEERIVMQNKIWRELLKINNAVKFIFPDSPALIAFFRLTKKRKKIPAIK